jgi:hypothetical protein
MRRVCGVLAVIAIASAAFGGVAHAGGGNSDAAKACQKGGWQSLHQSDGTAFENQGDCVAYAAQGGSYGAPCMGGPIGDARLTGPIDTLDDLTGYDSNDVTCSGPVDGHATIVSAPDSATAMTECLAVVPSTTYVFKVDAFFFLTAPADWWWCQPE